MTGAVFPRAAGSGQGADAADLKWRIRLCCRHDVSAQGVLLPADVIDHHVAA